MDSMDYSFIRYLSAKSTVDDRALNRYVWHTLAENLPGVSPGVVLRILEIGCGIGTMLTRMLDWGLVGGAEMTAPLKSACRSSRWKEVISPPMLWP